MYYNPYALPLFITAGALLLLAYQAWHLRSAPGVKAFTMLAMGNALYAFFYALEISSLTLDHMMLWLRFQYIGITAIPGTYLLFAFGYTGRISQIKGPVRAAFFFIPILTLLLFWTNDSHYLMYQTITLDIEGLFPVIHFERGLWYWVHSGYTASVVFFSCAIMAQKWIQSADVYRKQIATMLIGSTIPLFAFFLYQLRPLPWNIDINPFVMLISCLIFFYGLARFRLFDLIPIARTKLFEELPDGVLFFDYKLRIVDLNSAAIEYFPVTKDSIGKPADEELQDWPELAKLLSDTVGKRNVELSRTVKGNTCWFRIDLLPLVERSVPYGQMIIIREITARKRAEEMLQKMATTDELTNLANRRHFMQNAGLEVKRAARYGQVFSLVMLDIDHFKHINDTLGHSAGDLALQHIASIIKGRIRENDIPGRFGGEEFCILLPNTNQGQAFALAEYLRQEIYNAPFIYDNRPVHITASFGIASYHPGVKTIDDMLKAADAAMYQAKAAGRNCTRAAEG